MAIPTSPNEKGLYPPLTEEEAQDHGRGKGGKSSEDLWLSHLGFCESERAMESQV